MVGRCIFLVEIVPFEGKIVNFRGCNCSTDASRERKNCAIGFVATVQVGWTSEIRKNRTGWMIRSDATSHTRYSLRTFFQNPSSQQLANILGFFSLGWFLEDHIYRNFGWRLVEKCLFSWWFCVFLCCHNLFAPFPLFPEDCRSIPTKTRKTGSVWSMDHLFLQIPWPSCVVLGLCKRVVATMILVILKVILNCPSFSTTSFPTLFGSWCIHIYFGGLEKHGQIPLSLNSCSFLSIPRTTIPNIPKIHDLSSKTMNI